MHCISTYPVFRRKIKKFPRPLCTLNLEMELNLWCTPSAKILTTPMAGPSALLYVILLRVISPLLLWYTTSDLWCLSGGKRGDSQNCFVLYLYCNLCTVRSTLRWAVLTVLWIRFSLIGPISLWLCIDSFVLSLCILYLFSYCITVIAVGRTSW